LQRKLPHPHRQFQHLTPIRATWHPLVDLIVVGRYPDDKFPGYVKGELRTIDIMNPDDGTMQCQMSHPGLNKISSLNIFSHNGDSMLSGMGQTVLIWKQKSSNDEQVKMVGQLTGLRSCQVKIKYH